MALPYSDPPTHKHWVSEGTEPVVTIEVTLISAPCAKIDWVRGDHRDEAIRAIVERCAGVVESEFDGRVEHVRHTTFNHHGLTVHMVVAARSADQVASVVERHLSALERTLETRLQAHFGWEQAAVSVQVEPHPSYHTRSTTRDGAKISVGGEIAVYQPPGGSNAIAPVVVTIPSQSLATLEPPLHALPYPREQSSNGAIAGLLGALIAVAVAILVAVSIGPLVDEIRAMDAERGLAAERLRSRNQQIATLQAENVRLQDTIARLVSRRGRPAIRGDQPTRALPDTDIAPPPSPLASAPPASAASAAASP